MAGPTHPPGRPIGGGLSARRWPSRHRRRSGTGPSISAYFIVSALFGSVTLPASREQEGQRDRDQPGLSSGNQEKSTPCSIDGLLPVASTIGLPDTTGEKMISVTEVIRPP